MFGISTAEEMLLYISMGGGSFIYSDIYYKYLDSTPVGRALLMALFIEVMTAIAFFIRKELYR